MTERLEESKPTICFVCPEVCDALFARNGGGANGAEFQQAMIARQLAKRGYPVSFVTDDRGQGDVNELRGIRVFTAYRRSAGPRFVRFIHPRITGLWAAMKRSDADIYFQRTSDVNTGLVAAFCRRHNRKFVFSVASDANCLRDLPGCPRHERAFYRYGLHRADRVIAQTASQKCLLRENFAVESIVIPNCGQDRGGRIICGLSGPARPPKRLLWIGRWIPAKRLEMLLDVAQHVTDTEFNVVGEPGRHGSATYINRLRDRLTSLTNVHVRGRVSRHLLGDFYGRSGALICTSRIEGFPNTFVEAWRHGLPVISTFDPDDLIAERDLGYVASDASGLIESVNRLLGSPERWRQMSVNAREHFLENHSMRSVIPRFEEVFDNLMGGLTDLSSRPIGRPAA